MAQAPQDCCPLTMDLDNAFKQIGGSCVLIEIRQVVNSLNWKCTRLNKDPKTVSSAHVDTADSDSDRGLLEVRTAMKFQFGRGIVASGPRVASFAFWFVGSCVSLSVFLLC